MEIGIANYVIAIIGIGIFLIFKNWYIEARKEEAQKKDVNVTFKNGISLEKKQYPEMKDNFRESSYKIEPTQLELRDAQDRAERHSISGHMNDPSEMQKKAFNKNEEGE